jgi:adenylate cyclase
MADEGFKRKLTAILSADVIGYSRLMRNDEEATVRDLAANRALITEIIQQHHGRVVDSPGDNILAEFPSVVDAVNGAIRIQEEIKRSNTGIPEDRRMEFRIGVNLGDVIEEEERLYGDGVNIAARVEGLATAGGISISGTVYEHIRDKLSLGYHYLGERDVKNIPEPVRVYQLLTEPKDAGKMTGEEKPKSMKFRYAAFGAFALIILVAVAIGIWKNYFRVQIEPASVEKMAYPLPEKPSIAVLSFDNLSGDPEQEFLGDAIAQSIITALSQDPDLFIIARNSTFSYKGKPVKIQKVAEDLGVRYVLEGSVQKSGDRIRIAAQLLDAISGHHLWAYQYDRNLEDLFALQDEIIIKILTALQVKLTSFGEQARQAAMGTKNPKAFLKYLKAREYLFRWNKNDNFMARQVLEEVIALDPDYSYAYSSLAWTYLNDLYFNPTKSPGESIGKALELVQQALALDDTLSVAIETLGYIYMLKGKHDKAIAEYERAITLNPNLPDLLARSGIVLTYIGRLEEAITSFEKAIRLNPIPPGWYLRNLARCHRMVRRYEDSISTYKAALDRSPDDLYAQAGLTATYSVAGRLNEARAQAAEVLRVQPKFSSERYAKTFPFRDKTETDQLIAALRKAGLPD